MLDQCREEELEHRLPNFAPVLKVLEAIFPSKKGGTSEQQEKEEETRLRKARQGEEVRLRKELGESVLSQFVWEALDRTQGKPTQDDSAAAGEICKQYGVTKECAKLIVDDVREKWQKAQRPKE